MVTPARRRKTRTPSRKVSRKTANKHFKKKNLPQGLPIDSEELKKKWSLKASPRQNYDNMGLMLRLNGNAGGNISKSVDKSCMDVDFSQVEELKGDWNELDGGLVKQSEGVCQKGGTIVVEEGRIGKDADGNLIVLSTEKVILKTNANATEQTEKEEENEIIKELERVAKEMEMNKCKHPIYEGEIEFVKLCISKYGDDYKKMARDSKVNSLQLTPKQIKHKCERYLARLAEQS